MVEPIVIWEKPMSANKAYMGRKRKTKEYRVYTENVLEKLPDLEIPSGNLSIKLEVYYSNRRADIDNFLKPFIDIMQARYGFNDNKIYKLHVEKFIVPKGEERIAFLVGEADAKPSNNT